MPVVRTLLRPVAVALLLAAGLLQPWAAPAAHACSMVASPTAKIPVSQATEEDRRWAINTGPDWVEVIQPRELEPDAVLFDGTAVATGALPPDADGYLAGAPTWTFRVERVLWGDLPREVVVVGGGPDGPCGGFATRLTGTSTRVAAMRDPDTGHLFGMIGRWAPPRRGALPALALPRWPAAPGGAALGTWLTPAFLAEIAILGLAALAGVVSLRSRELDLEERELALRERETRRD
jgi:hypothetical protein